MIKKLLILTLLMIFNFSFVNFSYSATREVWDPSIQKSLIQITNDNIINTTNDDWLVVATGIFKWTKDTLTSLIVLVAVWVFLFIWIRLAMARGNPEEFKKAMMQMIYAAVWIFIVSIAWAAVVLVAGITI